MSQTTLQQAKKKKSKKTARAATEGELLASFASGFTSATVLIVVGVERVEYHLHEVLLVKRTPYFAALLRSGMQESKSRCIILSTEVDREDAFAKYVEYLYLDDYDVDASSDSEKTGLDDTCLLHANIHVLAERFCDDALKQLSLAKLSMALSQAYDSWSGKIVQITTKTVARLIVVTYDNTPNTPNTPSTKLTLRALISKFAASCWSELKNDDEIRTIIARLGDFVSDTLLEAGNGPRITATSG
ncbi:hypothetical protein V496_00438 [Pseudogymnoascus sp. VKM F-4515 (FW-2607)]|nr:hypothetical protein V496_00438 [Pseudogymnoascus sp. VKM F-4515 (FW-2607)]